MEGIINNLKQNEKELNQKEYFIKKQTLENIYFINKIASKIENFSINLMPIVGEIKGINDEIEQQKKKLNK